MIINHLTNEELIEFIYKAAAEYEKLINYTYLIIGKNSRDEYCFFQCTFPKDNFMHLVGIKSNICNAEEFFDRCADYNHYGNGGIDISYCSPSPGHGRRDMNRKASSCAEILNLTNIESFSMGEKDKTQGDNIFHYVYASDTSVLGFKRINRIVIPKTFMPGDNIDRHASQVYKMQFIFRKKSFKNKYKFLYVERTPGLFDRLYLNLPEPLKNMINTPIRRN